MVSDSDEVAFRFLIRNLSGDAEGLCMERCLWNEAIGERDAQKSSNTGSQPEEKDIPVKARWLAKGKFGSLRDEG